MNYAELLKGFIKKSRLTLDEISEEMNTRGLTASKQYLSKLQNGRTAPASEKMNRALAKIIGGDEEKLVMEAYLEKAPSEVKKLLNEVKTASDHPSKTIEEHILKGGESYNAIRNEMLKSMSPEYKEKFLHQTNTPNKLINFIESLDIITSKAILNSVIADNSIIYLIFNEYLKGKFGDLENNDIVKVNDQIRVPLLGTIMAGNPVIVAENIEGYTTYPNPGSFNEDELFMLRVKGDSMIGSRIHDGDKVLVHLQPDVENGEIAVVNVNCEEATLKKVKKLYNGEILLLPSNDKYDPILIQDENARIVGKVIQVIFEP